MVYNSTGNNHSRSTENNQSDWKDKKEMLLQYALRIASLQLGENRFKIHSTLDFLDDEVERLTSSKELLKVVWRPTLKLPCVNFVANFY